MREQHFCPGQSSGPSHLSMSPAGQLVAQATAGGVDGVLQQPSPFAAWHRLAPHTAASGAGFESP